MTAVVFVFLQLTAVPQQKIPGLTLCSWSQERPTASKAEAPPSQDSPSQPKVEVEHQPEHTKGETAAPVPLALQLDAEKEDGEAKSVA